MKKGIILLSGGLDSLVSLDIAKKECKIVLALTFDYNQKAFFDEKKASSDIADYYGIEHSVVKLPFLSDIAKNALTDENNDNFNELKSVWIPNRNGLFLSIAAAYADAFKIDYIIIGANKQEAQEFSDNTPSFIDAGDNFFKYSTISHPKIFAPCLEFDKIQIVNYAIDNNLPLKLIKSCYKASQKTGQKHCGECMSCNLLKQAVLKSKNPDLYKEIFS